MAEKIVIEQEVKGGESVEKAINNFSRLKKELKDAKGELASFAEGTKGFQEASKKVQKLTDDIGDLNDVSKINGTGVEKLTASFGLLKESIGSADFDKAKLAFDGIGKSMSAIPIFLLIEGLKLLIDNFETVISIAKSFTAEAQNQAKAIRELNAAYSDVLGNLDEINERSREKIRLIEEETSKSIELAKRRGASQKELDDITEAGALKRIEVLKGAEANYLKQKQFADAQVSKAIISGNDEVYKQAKVVYDATAAAYVNSVNIRKDAESDFRIQHEKFITAHLLAEEKVEPMTFEVKFDEAAEQKAEDQVRSWQNKTTEIQVEGENLRLVNSAQSVDKQKAIDKDALEDAIKNQKEKEKSAIATINAISSYAQQVGNVISSFMQLASDKLNQDLTFAENRNTIALQNLKLQQEQALQDLRDKHSAENELLDDQKEKALSRESLTSEQRIAINDKFEKKKKAQAKESIELQRKTILDEYALKLAAFSAEQKLKEKIFEQDKKVRISQTIINTITGSLQAVSAGIQAFGLPAGAIIGGVVAAGITTAGLLAVENIQKQKFDEGVPPSLPVLPSVPKNAGGDDSPGGPSSSVNRRTLFSTGASQNLTVNGNDGQQQAPLKAYVVSTEISSQLELDKSIESKTSF